MFAKQVIFSGQVQGVGFRYMTVRSARQYDVAGWVKNLPNGQVELQVKGRDDQVEKFLDEIVRHSSLSANIYKTEVNDVAADSIAQCHGIEIQD